MKILINPFVVIAMVLASAASAMQSAQGVMSTPEEYYNYQYYHCPHWVKSWENQKAGIRSAIEEANNDRANIKTIVNQPEMGKWGLTPLCKAIEMNDFDFVQFLLNNGAEVNAPIKGVHSSRPIFFAETLEMVKLLENAGADIKVFNEGTGVTRRQNLLHSILHTGNKRDVRLVKYLVKKGFIIEDILLEEDKANMKLHFYKAFTPGYSYVCYDCQHRLESDIKGD